MRLLFLNHNVIGRGTFQRAFGFARELSRRGHDVTLVTTSERRRFSHREAVRLGVRVIESPDLLWGRARNGWDPWGTLWRLGSLRSRCFDLVHAFDSRPAVVSPALALQRRGIPLVMDWADWWGRGGAISERTDWLSRRGFAPAETYFEESFRTKADGTTVISGALGDRAARLGVCPERTIRLVNGADVDRVVPVHREKARSQLGIRTDLGPVIGHLGVLRSDAGLLYRAFGEVARRRPGAILLLIGDLQPLPSDPFIVGRIVRTGFVTDHRLRLLLGACDVLVLPQRDILTNRARWPGKLGDYLCAARPVVATEVGDLAHLVGPEDGVLLVPPRPDAVVEGILAVSDRPELRARMGSAARRCAEGTLSWGRLTDQLELLYDRVRASAP
jgi:glycosyltransferase involved in cell wall biosynthesis